MWWFLTQGVALGWYVMPFQGWRLPVFFMKANRYAVADGPPALHIASDARHYAGFRPICLIQLTCPLPPAPCPL
mgnify:CR=1 FL=1|jgi:hypothetical protein